MCCCSSTRLELDVLELVDDVLLLVDELELDELELELDELELELDVLELLDEVATLAAGTEQDVADGGWLLAAVQRGVQHAAARARRDRRGTSSCRRRPSRRRR